MIDFLTSSVGCDFLWFFSTTLQFIVSNRFVYKRHDDNMFIFKREKNMFINYQSFLSLQLVAFKQYHWILALESCHCTVSKTLSTVFFLSHISNDCSLLSSTDYHDISCQCRCWTFFQLWYGAQQRFPTSPVLASDLMTEKLNYKCFIYYLSAEHLIFTHTTHQII